MNFVLQSLDASTLSLTWEPPSPEHRNGVILQYSVNVTHVETSSTQQSFTSSTSKVLTSLHPDYTYECSVAAETSVGRGPYRTQTIRMPEAREYHNCLIIYCSMFYTL